MDRLDYLLQIVGTKEAYEHLSGGASSDHIHEVESQLRIRFPDEYKYFLSRVGYVSWFGHSICGFSPEDTDYDTVYRTLKMREAKLPSGFTPIRADGNIVKKYEGGGYYFLTAKGSPDENQVILFTDDAGGNASRGWNSFTDFFEHFSRF